MTRFVIKSKSTLSTVGAVAAVVTAIAPVIMLFAIGALVNSTLQDLQHPFGGDNGPAEAEVILAICLFLGVGSFLVFLIERSFVHEVQVLPDEPAPVQPRTKAPRP